MLLLDAQPLYRTPDLHEKALLRHQVFDLTTEVVRATLANAVADVERRLETVQGVMRRYLAERCSIEQMLEPSTY